MERKCCEKLWHVGILVLFFSAVIADAQNADPGCLSDFTPYTITSTETECARVFPDRVPWDAADMRCKLIFGNLSAKIYEDSSLHVELKNKGIELLWMNIRRRAGFFINTSSILFEEKKDVWGNFWAEGEPSNYDCVALHVTDGSLIAMDCKTILPFVCTKGENDASYRASRLDCPDEYALSIPLSTNPDDAEPGRKCLLKGEEKMSFDDSTDLCADEESHEATLAEYEVLLHANEITDKMYWNQDYQKNCSSSSAKLHLAVECMEPRRSLCVKSLELENVNVYITMNKQRVSDTTVKLNAEISPAECERLLQCETDIPEDIQRHRLVYQWYKDDLPISKCNMHQCKLAEWHEAARKWNGSRQIWFSTQGSYHCEVRLVGLTRTYSSPRVEVFIGDTASYVIDIQGIPLSNYLDFSHHQFVNSTRSLRSNIAELLKGKDGFPDAVYDFQSLSVQNGFARMKVSVGVGRIKPTASAADREGRELEYYTRMKILFENSASLFSPDGSISLSVSSAVIADAQNAGPGCLSDFTNHTITSTETECASVFPGPVPWDTADRHCKLIFRNLSAKIYEDSSLHVELATNCIKLLWMNIRRRADFFINTSSILFEEKKDVWGKFWAEGEPRNYDCVALNVTDGSLITRDCKTTLPFVCTKGEKSASYSASRVDCPDKYALSIPLSTNPDDTEPGRKCVLKGEKKMSFDDSTNLCDEEGSHAATLPEYKVLLHAKEIADKLYWNQDYQKNCSSSSAKLHLGGECMEPRRSLCVKSLELENVTVYITMGKQRLSDTTVKLKPEISRDGCEHLLQCETDIPEDIQKHRIIYQWYKDDLPISKCNIHLCKLEYLNAAMKWHGARRNWFSIQGSYHCEVRLVGLTRTYSSPRVEVFIGDIASYVIDIQGITLNHCLDFSHHQFMNSTQILRSNIDKLLKGKDGLRIAVYDFQSMSVQNGFARMKVSVYVNRTKPAASAADREGRELKYYTRMKNLFENSASFSSLGGSISLSVSSADVCFSNPEHLVDGYCKRLPTSLQNTFKQAADSPSIVCLDEYGKLITRRCIGSFTSKAEWSPFNCSLCKNYYEAVPDLQFECPDGFSNLNGQELCYRIYDEKKNWNDAYETCSISSSYLMNDLHKSFNKLTKSNNFGLKKFWISYKYHYGKVQGVGRRPRDDKITQSVSIEIPELHCVAVVFENNIYELKLENCSEKMSFVCIQNPYELLSSVKFTHTWTKLNGRDACYYFDNNHVYNKISSIKTCEQTFHDAKLLQGINDYQYLKKLIYRQNFTIHCNRYYTWWINASTTFSTNYADWSPYEDFSTEKQRTITLFSDKKVYWTLAKEDSDLGLICQMEKCEDDRPTKAYIEDRTVENQLDSEDPYGLKNFELKCVPSGWFVASSVRWYKDGILLNDKFDRDYHFIPNTNISTQKALDNQGYYSCSVDGYSPIKTVYSARKLFKVKGFHTFILMMASKNKNYFNECIECMANDNFCQDNSLANCFENNFKHVLSNSYDFLIKNQTCNSTHLNVIVHVYYEEKDRKEEDILKEIKTTDFHEFCETCNFEHTVTSRSSEKCFRETSILENVNVTWPTISVGGKTYTEEKCVSDGGLLERECLGDFNSGAVWSKIPGDKCMAITSEITKGLHKILTELLDNNDESLPKLLDLTSSPEKLQSVDVQFVELILDNLANDHSLTNTELKIVVKVISNLINVSPGVLKKKSSLPSQIFEHLEQMSSNIEVDYSDIKVSAENMHLNIYPFSPGIDSVPNCVVLRNGSIEAKFNASSLELLQRNRNFDAGIVLPQSFLSENMNASDRLIFSIARDFSVTSNIRVVSFIISATLPNVSVQEFPKDEVTLFFRLFEKWDEEKEGLCSKKKKKTVKSDSAECVYWDDSISEWSYKGCFRRSIKKDVVICVCNHLSRFAVILGVDSDAVSKTHEKVLSYITWIGGSLSCLGFAIIIVTFITFRDFRKYLKNKILFNYSISQCMFLIIFMTSIDQTSSKVYCKTAAILSHYFLLSSFAWMIALAYTLYLSFVKILGTYVPCLLQKLMVFAWGVPAIIVIIVLSINIDYYSQDNMCWICQDVIVYAVTTPLIVMLILNYVIFGTMVYLNIFKKSSLRLNQERKKILNTRIKALFCTSILLGLSWIFGVLSLFGDVKLTFQYLFSITTPLQGFLLAISFVIRPKSTRELWLKLLSPSMYDTSHSIHSVTATHKEENSQVLRPENATMWSLERNHHRFYIDK